LSILGGARALYATTRKGATGRGNGRTVQITQPELPGTDPFQRRVHILPSCARCVAINTITLQQLLSAGAAQKKNLFLKHSTCQPATPKNAPPGALHPDPHLSLPGSTHMHEPCWTVHASSVHTTVGLNDLPRCCMLHAHHGWCKRSGFAHLASFLSTASASAGVNGPCSDQRRWCVHGPCSDQ